MTYTLDQEATLRELVSREAALAALAGVPVCQRCGAPRPICAWMRALIRMLRVCHGFEELAHGHTGVFIEVLRVSAAVLHEDDLVADVPSHLCWGDPDVSTSWSAAFAHPHGAAK